MVDARRMGKSELFSHFAERFEVKRTQAREYFDELTQLAEKELKRSGEFVLPGMVKLVVQKRKARMGRNPATGEAIKIPAKTVVKARIAKQLKDAVLPKKIGRRGSPTPRLATFQVRRRSGFPAAPLSWGAHQPVWSTGPWPAAYRRPIRRRSGGR
jgi:DNA-binding protein HU-beta